MYQFYNPTSRKKAKKGTTGASLKAGS
uniref:Uncharacterized protein n=1 Tax=Tetranychus urticae TaxID=32264 RepID=T1L3T2_TETUR